MTKKKPAIRPARCLCCSSTDRAQIEMLRCAGASYEALSAQFNISADSIWRHFQRHVSERRKAQLLAGPARVNDLVNSAAKESKSLLEYLGIMRSVLFNQFLASAEANDRQGVVNVSSQLLAALRQLGTVTGELRQMAGLTINSTTVNNFASSPAYLALVEVVLEQLRDLPERRAAIVQAIRGFGDDAAAPGPNGSAYAAAPALIEGELAHVE